MSNEEITCGLNLSELKWCPLPRTGATNFMSRLESMIAPLAHSSPL